MKWRRNGCLLPLRLPNERIPHDKPRKATEIPVCCPQFPHAVQPAEGGDPRGVDPGPDNPAALEVSAKRRPIAIYLRQEGQDRRAKPGASSQASS